MEKWSVALFGHFKHIPNQADDPVEFAAAVKRAQPGDVIAYRPWSEHYKWTQNERKRFLIVCFDGFTEEQMMGLVEAEYDVVNGYPDIPLLTQSEWESDMLNVLQERGDQIAITAWENKPQSVKDEEYIRWEKETLNAMRFPVKYHNKRRFIVDPADLAKKGVDIDRMVDTGDEYCEDWVITPEDIYDRIKKRKVDKTKDGLNPIKPRTDEEIKGV